MPTRKHNVTFPNASDLASRSASTGIPTRTLRRLPKKKVPAWSPNSSDSVRASDLAYPVYYDLEKWTWKGHQPPTDPNVYNDIVNNWYGALQSAGYKNLGVYSYTSYLQGR